MTVANRILEYALALVLIPAGAVFYMTNMPGTSYSGVLPPLTSEEAQLGEHLREHIARLAGEIGERNVWRDGTLEAAADYIEAAFREMDFAVSSQAYTAEGTTVRNLEVVLKGTSLAEDIIVIGAHYDTVRGSPGANDNSSGVAALLEIARFLRGKILERSVRFVAFVNEEAPFFYSPEMGSYRYARRAREHGEKIIAMLSLETIGYYSDVTGSQHYPNAVYSWFYPDTANFIGFVGNLGSRKLVRRCLDSFRRHTAFPSEGVAAPGGRTGIHWSDHWSFWEAGYPALMVTDTALFRYPHYHASTDTPDKIDYERLARVVMGLAKVTVDLAQAKP
ncbi:MAG: M28 family peptidase [Gammaproteobacteria bacterium]